ncbi:MAG: serine/threonine-protein kinase [Ignavibacteriales bacterium]|nr:serine/threonine-protein kinase [Ignavibacteriales bacterium]
MIGQTISQYNIIEKLGEGGMGVVYKAQDTKLDRFVALKFLPSHLAASEQDKSRFIQEAKSASALNHPNVCTIHDIQEHTGPDGVNQLFIVMEFVDGKSLKEKKETLGQKQILEIGVQVAEGLAAAHERGIVHRDIKPDNIMIRKDGIVQIMDFGLAKLYTSGNVSRLTKAGTTMGTMGYMSPEQVQGLDVDHRTDIFSLGVVLYELLAGASPFKGVHETAIMYEIVNVDPPPISTVKEGITPELDDIILECLEKEKDDRCQSAKELAKDLRKIKKSTGHTQSRAYSVLRTASHTSVAQKKDDVSSGSFVVEVMNRRFDLAQPFRSSLFPWMLSVVLILSLVVVWVLLRAVPAENIVTKFTLDIGEDKVLDVISYPSIAISNNGRKIVFKANNKFYLRKMDSMDPVVIPGIENCVTPFFSADDKWLGYFRNGKLEKISLSGGTPITLADAADNRGGTWSKNGFIVYTPIALSGLFLISENGGTPKSVTVIDSSKQERTHRWPTFLPDGKHVLFTVGVISSPDYYENANIDVVDIETGERKRVLQGASTAKYITSGHLLFSRSGILYVVPFDADKLEISGQPVPAVQGVYSATTTGITNYVVSENGTLAYLPGPVEGESRKIVKIDLKGSVTILDSSAHPYIEPALSPDNKRIALAIRDAENFDIWTFDIARNTMSKLTFGGLNRTPRWSPDGKKIAYMKRTKEGMNAIYIKPSDGSGDEVEIFRGAGRYYVNFWSSDGKYLMVDNLTTGSQSDLLVIPLTGDKTPWRYLDSKKDEYESSISPDGKWLSYICDESGSYHIYVRSFPKKEGKWQISSDVAEEPRWSPDGKFLYYRRNSQLMAVPVSTASTFSSGLPAVLFDNFPAMNVDSGISYDITSDGKYFVTTMPVKGISFKNISVVVNWSDEIRSIIPDEK